MEANSNCEITLLNGDKIFGACDPSQYEKPYEGPGYDPNWVSCFFTDKNYEYNGNRIYCFHPNQGHDNGPFTGGKGEVTTEIPKVLPATLPATGSDLLTNIAYSVLIAMVGVLIVATIASILRGGRE